MKPSCVVLVPVAHSIELGCETGLRELESRGYEVRRVRGYAAIDQCRSQLATDALADGFDELLWIDSDIAFDADDVERLRQHQLPLACAIYPKKGRKEIACHVLPGTESLTFGASGGLVEILYAGAGFLHTRRSVFEAIQRTQGLPICNRRDARPLIPWFMPMVKPDIGDSQDGDQGYWYLAEDFAFCERARRAGFGIFADTRIRLGHCGSYEYRWEDAGLEIDRYSTFTLKLE